MASPRQFQPQRTVGGSGAPTAPINLTAGEANAGMALSDSVQRGSDQYVARSLQVGQQATKGQLVMASSQFDLFEQKLATLRKEHGTTPDKYRAAAESAFGEFSGQLSGDTYTNAARGQVQTMLANAKLAYFGNEALEGSVDYETLDMQEKLANAQLWKQREEAIALGDTDQAVAFTEEMSFANPELAAKEVGRARSLADSQRDTLAKAAHAEQLDKLSLRIEATDNLPALDAMLTDLKSGGAIEGVAEMDDGERKYLLNQVESQVRQVQIAQSATMSSLTTGITRGEYLSDGQLDELVARQTGEGISEEDARQYRFLRDNAAQAGTQRDTPAYKADKASGAYELFEKRIEEKLFKVVAADKQIDAATLEQVLNEVVSTNSLTSVAAKADLVQMVLRARAVDLDDGKTDDHGLSFFSGVTKMSDQEVDYRRQYYERLKQVVDTMPMVRGAGGHFLQIENDIHKLFERETPPTEEELIAHMRTSMRPLFDEAAMRQIQNR